MHIYLETVAKWLEDQQLYCRMKGFCLATATRNQEIKEGMTERGQVAKMARGSL